ncbi:hypothetical protein LTR05_006336 [Lithohypha guttulata]|uniref:Uncharacterized protein n=1 Tax=Lithohypha guttulata TaxID=1690604 RepID=A0AAN7SX42_9EURO|nr:hypothetical protein LTR05_006336 [Lithohypha guttulata]
MGAEDQKIIVDEIAEDEEKLVEKVKTMSGTNVQLDADEATGNNLVLIDSSVCAVLVNLRSAEGTIRITGKNVALFVPTGPDEKHKFAIVTIENGQTGMLLGQPSVRYFRRIP